jgi:hypothetical protein
MYVGAESRKLGKLVYLFIVEFVTSQHSLQL